jgi:hypothetical protein
MSILQYNYRVQLLAHVFNGMHKIMKAMPKIATIKLAFIYIMINDID